jgi:hypothetical protein
VEQAKANVTNARLNLDYTTITAPVSGLSSYAKKQVGSYIDASNSLLTYVAKLDPIWVNFSLSENEVLQYQSQQASGQLKMPPRGSMEVEIVLADGATYGKRGHITFADASFSSETGTYLLRAEFPNTEGALRPGNSCASACLARSARARSRCRRRPWCKGSVDSLSGPSARTTRLRPEWWMSANGRRATGSSAPACAKAIPWWSTARCASPRRAPQASGRASPARVHRTAAWPPGAAPTPASAPTAAPEKGDVMKLSHFFIDRPIFASVLSIIIVVGGLVAMVNLPIAQFPDITPPTITVTTTYPGASSDVVAQNVAAPIEQQVNGADNMLYMSSTSSSTGNMTLTVYFEIGTDPSLAQVDVQNRVNLALPTLPDAVTKQGVSVQKRSSAFMMVIAVYSPDNSYPQTFVDNFTNIYILDALKRIPGANQASIFGTPDYAMRIWLKPDRMAQLGITVEDIKNAVANQNEQFSAGRIGQSPTDGPVTLTFPVTTKGRMTEPAEFENIILRAASGDAALVRLKDVARAELGSKDYSLRSRYKGKTATLLAVYQQPGANALAVAEQVEKRWRK